MLFLKRHYEKIILSLVLLGLVGTAVWLLHALGEATEKVQSASGNPPPPKVYKGVSLTNTIMALENLKAPPPLILSGEHNLFNPVTWKKKYDGTLIKIASGKEEGPDALTIVKINPLHFTINYEKAAGSGYYLGVTREAAATPGERKKKQVYISLPTDARKDFFTVRSITGTGDDVSISLEVLVAKGKTIFTTITPTQSYDRIDGYSIDLRYDLESGKDWKEKRIDDIIYFYGDAYKIVYIDENEVRIMANSNAKQTTIKWKAAR